MAKRTTRTVSRRRGNNKGWKGRLQPHAERIAALERHLLLVTAKAPDAQLNQLIADCSEATETNCWWAIFEVAQLLGPVAKARLKLRRDAADQRLKNAMRLARNP